MRGRGDPAWRRYYEIIDRAALLLREGRIGSRRFQSIHEAARRRAYRAQV